MFSDIEWFSGKKCITVDNRINYEFHDILCGLIKAYMAFLSDLFILSLFGLLVDSIVGLPLIVFFLLDSYHLEYFLLL